MKTKLRTKTKPMLVRSISIKFTDGSGYLACSMTPHTKDHWRRHAVELALRHGKTLDGIDWFRYEDSE